MKASFRTWLKICGVVLPLSSCAAAPDDGFGVGAGASGGEQLMPQNPDTGGFGSGATSSGAVGTGGSSSGAVGSGGLGSGGVGSGGLGSGGVGSGGLGSGGVGSGGLGSGGVGSGGLGTGGQGSGGQGAGGEPGNCSASGFHVVGSELRDVNCNEFIMRGVNDPYSWYQNGAQQRYSDIASLGSNTVRVVLSTGGQWARVNGSSVADIISWTKSNQLVALLEVHDSTGYGQSSGAVHPDDAVNYWLSEDIRAAIDGQEAYVLINIANEPFGNNNTDQWEPFHIQAVKDLRAAGLSHTLVVDAPNWGQDWTNTMRDGDGATKIFDADLQRNVVFSIHMYDVYSDSGAVSTYFSNFLAKGLPLIVGEFAADHGPGNEVAEDAILAEAEARRVGYLGWSWSGNGGGLSSLDITQGFNPNSLTTWGQRLIHGENGLVATVETCSCFD